MPSCTLLGSEETFVHIIAIIILYWLTYFVQIGAKRLDAAAKKGNTYSWNLIFGGKKSVWTKLLVAPLLGDTSFWFCWVTALVYAYMQKVQTEKEESYSLALIVALWFSEKCTHRNGTVKHDYNPNMLNLNFLWYPVQVRSSSIKNCFWNFQCAFKNNSLKIIVIGPPCWNNDYALQCWNNCSQNTLDHSKSPILAWAIW